MALATLEGPYELLELRNQEIFSFLPLKYETGLMQISTRRFNPGVSKEIKVLRIWFDADPNVPGLDYRDITSQTLIVQLEPILKTAIKDKLRITIKAYGVAPTKRFTVLTS